MLRFLLLGSGRVARGCRAAVLPSLLVATALAATGAHARAIRHPKAEAKAAALAARDAKSSGKDATVGGKPQLVGTFGDWGAYLAQNAKTKICYALASPKERLPATLKREQAYVFISNRPGEGVRNEVSVILGFAVKEGASDAKAEVANSAFELVAKGQNAWMKNAAQESQLIAAMRKHARLVVKVPSAKGGTASDSYSLAGLPEALARVAKDCP